MCSEGTHPDSRMTEWSDSTDSGSESPDSSRGATSDNLRRLSGNLSATATREATLPAQLAIALDSICALLREYSPDHRRELIQSMTLDLRRQLITRMATTPSPSAGTGKDARDPAACARRPVTTGNQTMPRKRTRASMPAAAEKAAPRKRNRADRSVSVSFENLHIISCAQNAAEAISQRFTLQQLKQKVEQRRLQMPNETFRDRVMAAISAVQVPDGMCPSYFTRFRAYSTFRNKMVSTPTTKDLGEALQQHAKMHSARSEGSDALQEAWKSVVTEQSESESVFSTDGAFVNRHQVTHHEAKWLLAARLTNAKQQKGPIKQWYKKPRPAQREDQHQAEPAGATETIQRAENLLLKVNGCGAAGVMSTVDTNSGVKRRKQGEQ
mmetsp:Transcript_13747/g.25150  ORF Transcript_13747/g.25150 Transcript_13747/m.25150 type:complete len:383 (+) Transcript_13747:40-1188(+)